MKKIILASAMALVIATASASMGYLYGNMITYPSFSAMDPSRPFSDDEYELSAYRDEVEYYVAQGKEYIENCDSDIQAIQEERNAAIDRINRVVNEYNDFVTYGY